jgi:hypothetical protein
MDLKEYLDLDQVELVELHDVLGLPGEEDGVNNYRGLVDQLSLL